MTRYLTSLTRVAEVKLARWQVVGGGLEEASLHLERDQTSIW